MARSWKIIMGVILVVWLLRIFLIPDPFKLGLIITQFHENASDSIPTHVLIESDIWRSSILTINSNDYKHFRIQDIDPKKKKALSLFKANKIFRFTKSLSKQYQEGKLESYSICSVDEWIEGKFVYGNSVKENFILNTHCSDLGEEYANFLFKLIAEESARNE